LPGLDLVPDDASVAQDLLCIATCSHSLEGGDPVWWPALVSGDTCLDRHAVPLLFGEVLEVGSRFHDGDQNSLIRHLGLRVRHAPRGWRPPILRRLPRRRATGPTPARAAPKSMPARRGRAVPRSMAARTR